MQLDGQLDRQFAQCPAAVEYQQPCILLISTGSCLFWGATCM